MTPEEEAQALEEKQYGDLFESIRVGEQTELFLKNDPIGKALFKKLFEDERCAVETFATQPDIKTDACFEAHLELRVIRRIGAYLDSIITEGRVSKENYYREKETGG